MKYSDKEIEELRKIAGEEIYLLIKILKNKKRVSEIKLAEYCKKKLNDVRSMLYKLHNLNLVSFIKKRNKKTGWYVYYWGLDIKKMRDFFIDFKKKELKELKKDLKNEEHKKFYICMNKCGRFDFENASKFNFKCPECDSLLNYEENNKKIDFIKEKINNIKKIVN